MEQYKKIVPAYINDANKSQKPSKPNYQNKIKIILNCLIHQEMANKFGGRGHSLTVPHFQTYKSRHAKGEPCNSLMKAVTRRLKTTA